MSAWLILYTAGGGPNTVGVVLESTHITHPVTPLQVAFVGILTPTVEAAKQFVALSAGPALKLMNNGWAGYLAITPRIGEMSAVSPIQIFLVNLVLMSIR